MHLLLAQIAAEGSTTAVRLDLGHIILTVLSGTVVFFLQRELRRNDDVRKETRELIRDCKDVLAEHEKRLSVHGTNHVLLKNEVTFQEVFHKELKERVDRLEGQVRVNTDDIAQHIIRCEADRAHSGEHPKVTP